MRLEKTSQRIGWLLFVCWCLALTWFAYGTAIQLPFFFDDFVHLPFVDAFSLSEIWQTSGGLAYYRPLPFTIWELMYQAVGSHNPILQHGFNLLLHGLNGALVGWLAGRLWAQPSVDRGWSSSVWVRAFLSASLFLLYPFSYQAVPWVGSLAHVLVTFLILLSLATYWKMRLSGRRFWAVLSLTLTFLAPFAHENGILIGPFLAAILLTEPDWRQNLTRIIGHIALWSLPALIWLPIWWFAPKAVSGTVAMSNGETLLQNTTYFIQGMAYPLSWLGGRLRVWIGMNDMAAAILLSALALTGAALIQWLNGAGRRSLLPWLWMAIASLPAILFLSFDYVINGPRLLMLVSVGAAWLWSDVAIQAASWLKKADGESKQPAWLRISLVTALLLALLLQNINFIRYRMGLHQVLGATLSEAVSFTTMANKEGKRTIFVNMPAWIAPDSATFALGHEGVQFVPNYAPPDRLASVNSGWRADLVLVRNDAIRSEMPYHYGIAGGNGDWRTLAEQAGDVFVANYRPDSVAFVQAGTILPPGYSAEPQAWFEDLDGEAQIALLSANANHNGEGIDINLTWQVKEPPPDHVTVFVHVVDDQGQLVAQVDGDPLGGSYPLSQWLPGTAIEDRRLVALEGSSGTVLVGLYDRMTGNRYPAFSVTGQRLMDDAVSVPVSR